MSQNRALMEAAWGSIEGHVGVGWATGKTDTGKLMVNGLRWFRNPEELDAAEAFAARTVSGHKRNTYLTPEVYGDQVALDEHQQEIQRDGKPFYSRSPRNIVGTQTVRIDSDQCPPEAYRIPPSIVLETSPGNFQVYWSLVEPADPERVTALTRLMVFAHKEDGADPSAWSGNKLMRLPDGLNTKYDAENPNTITMESTGDVYDLEEIEAAYADVVLPASAKARTRLANVPVDAEFDESKLLAPAPLLQRIPDSETRLNELILKKPRLGDEGWRSEQRYALLCDLFRFGFNLQETVSIAWVAPVAQKWREDPAGRGVAGLWAEAEKAELEIKAEEQGAGSSPAPQLGAGRGAIKPIEILTNDERRRTDEVFGYEQIYMEWVDSKFPVYNPPYHRFSAVMTLSTIFGDAGFMPRSDGPVPLNLYGTIIGTSSSGKTQADNIFNSIITQQYPNDSIDLGSDWSKNALIETLIERRSKVSLIFAEEGHGMMKELVTGQAGTVGLLEAYPKIYDGKIPQQGRMGKGALRVPDAWGALCMRMSGTPDGFARVLDRSLFLSGFLARNIWIIGETREVTEDMMDVDQVDDDDIKRVYEAMPKYLASGMIQRRHYYRSKTTAVESRVAMRLTIEARARLKQAKWQIHQHFMNNGDNELFETSIRRMFDIIQKVATLFAMADGKDYVTVIDVLLALKHAEEWLRNLVIMAEQISDNFFSKACNEIEKIIASRDTVDAGTIYRRRNTEPKRDTDTYLQQLLVQGRIEMLTQETPGAARRYQIRQDRK